MVTKKEGATMSCNACGSDLICRLKDYGGNYPPSLQWQNYEGGAHYKTTDGKNYTCNIPDEEEQSQTRIPNPHSSSTSAAGTPPFTPAPAIDKVTIEMLVAIGERLGDISLKLQSLDEMVQAIFRYTVDLQLKKK